MSAPTPTAEYILSTDLKIGMVTTLGRIQSIWFTAKRCYLTIQLANGDLFEDHQPIANRCTILTWP